MSLLTVPLATYHDRAAFSCGNATLDTYMWTMAGQDIRRNVANVFIREGTPPPFIRGYYTLSMTDIVASSLPAARRRKLPRHDSVPGALIGRLAVSSVLHGKGEGAILLFDAIRRVIDISRQIAAYAITVDAIDEAAAGFYRHHGFEPFEDQPLGLFLPLATARTLV